MREATGRAVVRGATAADAAAVADVTLAAYGALPWSPSAAYVQRLGDGSARVAAGDVLVAEIDGTVVGTTTVVMAGDDRFEHPPRHGDGGFRMLAVAPTAQGRGVGRALADACLDRLRAAGARRVLITTMEQMAAARVMYTSMGFVRRGDLDVRYPGGRGLVMALDLVAVEPGTFAPAGPVPDEAPWYEDAPHRQHGSSTRPDPGCA